ncbi:hypothetical protein MKW98_026147 [Papaver atlanticum]|uniref:Uncharacterized protein n=1 Tax=Papaver atlanticum TaxID=357466 RepID=A0AAD4X5W7_9MAGN|nr:hypothetical protein MKW98_026147 [Papaver atlanticum]
MPATKAIASFKLPNYNSGKVEVQYFHDHATVTSAVGLNQSPAVDVTATVGSPSFAFGDTLTASYVHHLDALKRTSGVAEVCRKFSTNENTVGGSYAVDPLTSVKYRLNNHGNLGSLLAALMQRELKLKSFLTLSGEFDTKALDKVSRFGLSLAVKPWVFVF